MGLLKNKKRSKVKQEGAKRKSRKIKKENKWSGDMAKITKKRKKKRVRRKKMKVKVKKKPKRKKKTKPKAKFPGYFITILHKVSFIQGRIITWLKQRIQIPGAVEGRFEHYLPMESTIATHSEYKYYPEQTIEDLKKGVQVRNQAIKFGMTPGLPHIMIKVHRGPFTRCAIWLRQKRNKETMATQLEAFGWKTLFFLPYSIDYIENQIEAQYLDLPKSKIEQQMINKRKRWGIQQRAKQMELNRISKEEHRKNRKKKKKKRTTTTTRTESISRTVIIEID